MSETVKTIYSSFTQVRMDERMQEYTTYPNSTIVLEKDSGKMALISTDEPFECGDEIRIDCFMIHKDGQNLKEFLNRCRKFSDSGNVYLLELWESKVEEDTKFNEDLIMYFVNRPEIMFEKEETNNATV